MDKPTNKWKWAFLGSVVISGPVIVFLLYTILDQGLTITYMTEGYQDTEQSLQRLATIFPKETLTKKDIVYLLRKTNPEAFIVENECTVQLRGLRFKFNNDDKLININTNAEASPEKECNNS